MIDQAVKRQKHRPRGHKSRPRLINYHTINCFCRTTVWRHATEPCFSENAVSCPLSVSYIFCDKASDYSWWSTIGRSLITYSTPTPINNQPDEELRDKKVVVCPQRPWSTDVRPWSSDVRPWSLDVGTVDALWSYKNYISTHKVHV